VSTGEPGCLTLNLRVNGVPVAVELTAGELGRLRAALALRAHPGPWLDTRAAAAHLGVSRQRIHDLTSQGRLRVAGRDGRLPRYHVEDLDAYLRAGARERVTPA
jgi:excisionase family DNA binding protein